MSSTKNSNEMRAKARETANIRWNGSYMLVCAYVILYWYECGPNRRDAAHINNSNSRKVNALATCFYNVKHDNLAVQIWRLFFENKNRDNSSLICLCCKTWWFVTRSMWIYSSQANKSSRNSVCHSSAHAIHQLWAIRWPVILQAAINKKKLVTE